MKRALVVAAGFLVACGGTSSDGGRMLPSEAFCSDVRAGLSPAQLMQPGESPEDFASAAFGRMSVSCPEELEGWRWFFESWNINIDA